VSVNNVEYLKQET